MPDVSRHTFLRRIAPVYGVDGAASSSVCVSFSLNCFLSLCSLFDPLLPLSLHLRCAPSCPFHSHSRANEISLLHKRGSNVGGLNPARRPPPGSDARPLGRFETVAGGGARGLGFGLRWHAKRPRWYALIGLSKWKWRQGFRCGGRGRLRWGFRSSEG